MEFILKDVLYPLKNLQWAVYRIELNLVNPFTSEVAFLNATLRGALGHELFTRHCRHPVRCEKSCQGHPPCYYETIFGSHNTDAPRPYIISEIKLLSRRKLELILVTIGEPAKIIDLLTEGLVCAGRRGIGANWKFSLNSVEKKQRATSVAFQEVLGLFEKKQLWHDTFGAIVESLTPVHLVKDGRFQERPELEIIILSSARRLFSLLGLEREAVAYFSSQVSGYLSRQKIYADCQEVKSHSLHRYSTRQQQKITMPGLHFKMQIENLPGWLLVMLGAVQHLHIGKYTTLGFGKLRISLINDNHHFAYF